MKRVWMLLVLLLASGNEGARAQRLVWLETLGGNKSQRQKRRLPRGLYVFRLGAGGRTASRIIAYVR